MAKDHNARKVRTKMGIIEVVTLGCCSRGRVGYVVV